MKDNFISVIIPAYNCASTIEKCVHSVLIQGYRDFEIVIVNDGSTDNTAEMLNALSHKNDKIKVINKKNCGASSARNEGIRNANGEYITFLDCDDLLTPSALEDMIKLMGEDTDLVIGSVTNQRFNSMKTISFKNRVFTAQEIKEDFIKYDECIFQPVAKLYRAEIIRNNHILFDETIPVGEDHIFNINYSKYINNKVVVTNQPMYIYIIASNGLTSKYYQNMNELKLYIFESIKTFFGEMPKEYYHYFLGAYFAGLIKYYTFWLPLNQAAAMMKESYDMYLPLLNDDILTGFFTSKQLKLMKRDRFKSMIVDYAFTNPKIIIVGKVKSIIRRIVENFI